MEGELDLKLGQILESYDRIRQSSCRRISSSSYHHCSNDQIEEAETVGFSWTVEETINRSGVNADSNRFSQNPAAVPLMASCYLSCSDLYAGFCPLKIESTDTEVDFDYHDLLDSQNTVWGQHKVAEGIAAARDEKYEASIELCNAALSFLPNSVEALVCRGASSANINKTEEAVSDFERALKIDPSNHNAFQYLNKIKDNILVKNAIPRSIILPVEAVETRKPEWRVIPSNVVLSTSARDLIIGKLNSNSRSTSSSSSTTGYADIHRERKIVPEIGTVNGYAFETEESVDDVRSDSESIASGTKKRKRDKEGKIKKSKKDDKKKRHKHKDKKKERRK